MSLIVLVVLMGAFYAFMLLPQQRRMKAHQALLRSLEVGDVVVTNAGIHGAIAEVEEAVVWLEVAPDVELKVSKSAIAERIGDGDADADKADTDKAGTDKDADESDDVLAEADAEERDG